MATSFVFYDLPLPEWARDFQMPIVGAQIPQNAELLPGAARSYRNGQHEGVDIYCPYGTPVRAAKDGYILAADADYHEFSGSFRERLLDIGRKLISTPVEVTDILHGRQVILDHGYIDGHWVITVYSHLSKVAEDLSPEMFVKQDSIIGYVGNSGTSHARSQSQTHLHFEIRSNDHYLGEGMSPKEAGKLYAAIMKGGSK